MKQNVVGKYTLVENYKHVVIANKQNICMSHICTWICNAMAS